MVHVSLEGSYSLPVYFDLLAVFLFSFSGSIKAIEKGYDFVGVFILAMVTSTGGGLVRDVLLQQGTPGVLLDYRYLLAVFLAGLAAMLLYKYTRFTVFINIIDAISLGMYAVFGTQKAISFGLSIFAAFIIGFINAIGGGMIRDILVKEESHFFKPGQYYSVVSIVAIGIFLLLGVALKVHAELAATTAIITASVLRYLAVRFNWQTRAIKRQTD